MIVPRKLNGQHVNYSGSDIFGRFIDDAKQMMASIKRIEITIFNKISTTTMVKTFSGTQKTRFRKIRIRH